MTDPLKEEKTRLESNWVNPNVSWQNAKRITVGVDVGSVSSQAVILADEEILAFSNLRTGASRNESAQLALDRAMQKTDLPEDRIQFCVGTGYGRVNIPFSDKSITEISCIARGAHFLFGPSVRTVLDVGGQDIKILHCDEVGKVLNFHMNDKCAAGTGRGMEAIADFLGIPIDQIGERSFPSDNTSTAFFPKCVIYARSEAIHRVRKGIPTEEVLATYCHVMAENIFEVIKKLGVIPGFAVTGGMAKNRGVINRVLSLLNLQALETRLDPQIAGALGAAHFARALAQKGKKRKQK
jgi:benzoyl-CoA reductase subunit A